ncbi:MAG: monovalent cation/H+ antiporter complex subunit F [Planctomycetota bacterium]
MMQALLLPLANAHHHSSWMVLGAGVALLVATLLVLIRAIAGPTVYDRLLAVNTVGTKTVIVVALLGVINWPAQGYFVDIALVYALINFVTTVAILKFVEYRRLG